MYKKLLFSIFIFLSPFIASANTFPTDTLTLFTEQISSGNKLILATSTRTILFVDLQVSGSGTQSGYLYCGYPFASYAEIIAQTHTQDGIFSVPVNFLCERALYMRIVNIGSLYAHSSIDYVPRNRFIIADPNPYFSSTTATSTLPRAANFNEWLFAVSVVVFMLSLLVWRIVFSPIKRMYDT